MAVRTELTTIGTQMAGGRIVRSDVLSIYNRGVQNMMSHLEILLGEKQSSTVTKEKLRKLPGTEGFVFALIEDVFEPFHELGEKVFAGWKAGLVHSLVNPFEMPGVVHYEVDRILHGVWMIGKVVKGNCCAVIAIEFEV